MTHQVNGKREFVMHTYFRSFERNNISPGRHAANKAPKQRKSATNVAPHQINQSHARSVMFKSLPSVGLRAYLAQLH